MATLITDTLWRLTNSAVLRGRWPEARVMLENLAERGDYYDEIVTPPTAPKHIADRIDAVNHRAHINRTTR